MGEKQKSQQNRKTTIPPYMKAVSGSIGGIVEACCLQPIDVIKTRLQLDRSGTYKGIFHCGSTVSRTEGVRALWKGLTPFATHLTLKYALRMGSNAVLQTAFKDSETGKLSNQGRMIAGFGAGVLEALVIVTPFEVSVACIGTICCHLTSLVLAGSCIFIFSLNKFLQRAPFSLTDIRTFLNLVA
uniref:Uncharacterized protein n=1 Tax=Nelumbo nucifera TaxID=4432 RepID=A0A822Y1X9_NELNU|nr:TPA_asm: hypothetical protein HUJ06_027720 [Nelumbo nucifera]